MSAEADPHEYDLGANLVFARLALLSNHEYDRVRKKEASLLGIRVSTLDREVRLCRAQMRLEAQEGRPPDYADEDLALRFTNRHKNDLRYVEGWGAWMIYEGERWRADRTLLPFDLARAICREAAAECKSPAASGIASARTIAAVEKLAKADRIHAATVDDWDADPWALNTPGGLVDLRTGRIRSHNPDHYVTRMTAVTPGGECPMWRAFIDRVTGNDAEVASYLQRFFGYALTGVTIEHVLLFLYGLGQNGKGVFLNTLQGIFGDYSVVAPMDTFTASRGDRHPTDLAMLRGARLVTAQESEEGRQWAEARIKSMTGGDPLSARFMRQDYFTFIPQFKIVIVSNHKPTLRTVDDAMRRRLHLVLFEQKISKEERDPYLTEKLKSEWGGILAWMIEGCLMWQRDGLRPPAAIMQATADYFEAEDTVSNWMHQCCTVSGFGSARTTELFASFKAWALTAGEEPGSQKVFNSALRSRGFEFFHRDGYPHFRGLYPKAAKAHHDTDD